MRVGSSRGRAVRVEVEVGSSRWRCSSPITCNHSLLQRLGRVNPAPSSPDVTRFCTSVLVERFREFHAKAVSRYVPMILNIIL